MTNQSTIDKLIEMRLTATADAFRNQLDDPKCKFCSNGTPILKSAVHSF